MIKRLKEHKKLCYFIYIIMIILMGLIFCSVYNNADIAYSIEFETKSKFILYFDKNDIVVKAKCLNEICKTDIKVNEFIKTNYNDLERQLNFTLYNDLNNGETLNINLASGKKDIYDLMKVYNVEENETTNNNSSDNEANENTAQDDSNVLENNSGNNFNKVESKPNNNQNNSVENNSQINSSNQSNGESNIPQSITPLDVEIIWIPTSYSYYNVSFNSYSTTPMKYNQKDNGSVPYKDGNDVAGYMQIFDLKSQGITTDDACVTFTQNKYYNFEGGATTIVPLYNNKTVTYRKFCLGFAEDPYYHRSYKSIATSVNTKSNVYEWLNNKWTYIGILGNLKFTERNSQGYTQSFSLLTYIDLAYDRIINDQYPILVLKQRDALDALEKEEDKMEEVMETERQELIKICGYDNNPDITYECELKYIDFGNKWAYERGIIDEKRSEILGWDFNYMYDFSILDEK